MAETKDYVANELGHTHYPKMVYPNGNEAGLGVVANSPEHEAEIMGIKLEEKKEEKKDDKKGGKDNPPGWK